MNEVRIPNNKEISIVKSKINQRFNNQRDQISCALCGKELKNQSRSFHKSHTVPFFCLENIKGLYKKNYNVLKAEYIGLRTPFSDKNMSERIKQVYFIQYVQNVIKKSLIFMKVKKHY